MDQDAGVSPVGGEGLGVDEGVGVLVGVLVGDGVGVRVGVLLGVGL